MKIRPLAFACGAALATLVGLVLNFESPSLPTPVQEMRDPASTRDAGADLVLGPNAPYTNDPCTHLYQLICSQKGVTRDPTGSVRPDLKGEQMAVDVYTKITQEHPDYTPDQVNEELAKEIYTQRNRGRIEAAFRWVRHAIQLFIDEQPESTFSRWEKMQLKRRIRELQLQIPPPASVYSDEPDLMTESDVYYERLPNGIMRLRVGGAYLLGVHSWFNIVFTMAHEIAHSIDPCEVRSANLAFPAYDRLSACFMQQKLVPLKVNRFECGANDELSETFADWVAVHITARTLKNYSTEFQGSELMKAVINSVRDLCETPEERKEDDGYHPPDSVRIDRIFGRNPEIRSILGCEPYPDADREYCSFNYRVGKK